MATTTTERENTATGRENDTASSLGLTPLINGIIEDAQRLIRQQLALFQSDIRSDMNQAKEAVLPLAMALLVSLLAGFFLCMTIAYFVVWLWPEVPLVAPFAVITLLLIIGAAALLVTGNSKVQAFAHTAEKTVEDLKQNIEWTTKK